MTTIAEGKFKRAVRDLVLEGVHPTPTIINRKLGRVYSPPNGREYVSNNLNGRQCRWLRREMRVAPIRKTYHEDYARLQPCTFNCCTGNGTFPQFFYAGH